MQSKQLILSNDKSDILQAEWEDDFSYLGIFRNGKKIWESFNKSELFIGKSFQLEENILFIKLNKHIFNDPKLDFIINGVQYDEIKSIYRDKIFSLSVVFLFLASVSIVSFFDFSLVGFHSIISGLIYLGVGYLYFKEKNKLLGYILFGLLIVDLIYNFVTLSNKIDIQDIPTEISMKVIMTIIIFVSIVYVYKDKKIKE